MSIGAYHPQVKHLPTLENREKWDSLIQQSRYFLNKPCEKSLPHSKCGIQTAKHLSELDHLVHQKHSSDVHIAVSCEQPVGQQDFESGASGLKID